ncbi:MAG TPA: ECF-type sigma factor, partial [Pyrinomonadaceae bacterium]|nr:ECF-type sigma factor [Pyrinomonadaceae bacterium]
LKHFDQRKSKVVELRYFGGLSLEEAANALDISVMTVRRDWRAAKAWLFRRMRRNEVSPSNGEPNQSTIGNRQSHDT